MYSNNLTNTANSRSSCSLLSLPRINISSAMLNTPCKPANTQLNLMALTLKLYLCIAIISKEATNI